MPGIVLYLGRERDGKYMLTVAKPEIWTLDVAGKKRDLYVPGGDHIGLRHLCQEGSEMLLGHKLERLHCCKVLVTFKELQANDEELQLILHQFRPFSEDAEPIEFKELLPIRGDDAND